MNLAVDALAQVVTGLRVAERDLRSKRAAFTQDELATMTNLLAELDQAKERYYWTLRNCLVT